MANIVVNASTSLVNINTSNIPLTSSAVVLLSSVNAPGAIITIRDYAGLASTNRKIIISTTSDTQFLDGPQISSFEIVTPYGFFTVSPRDTSIWTVLNSFAFGSQPNASVSSLTSGVITSSNIFNSNTVSTPVTNTSTLIVGYRGIRAVQEGYDVLSTMVFTSSGNVGVYTSTPAAKLHVVGNAFLDQQSTLRFAGGQDGAGNSNLRYSYDGINWSNITSGDFGTTALDFAYNGSNRWVGVGSNGGTTGNIKYSGDGITWTNATYTSGGETGIRSVAWNGQIFLANGGAGGILYTSSDGITWTNSFPFPFTTGFCIAWNGQYWLAGGLTPSLTRTGSIARSTDGVTWTQNASGGFTAGCASLDWNGSYWVAVGSDTTAANRIQFSTDGLNWTNATSGYTNLTNGNSVHWNGSIWLAGGVASSSNDSLRYSTDGRVWLSSISRLTTVRGITWDGTKWIITGSTTSGSNLLYSFTGTDSWTNAGTRGNFNTTGNGVFMTNPPSLRASNLELHTQNIPSYTTSTNKVYASPSSLSLNDVVIVQNPGVNASNVGINTKTPSYTLDVNGSINVSTIFVNGIPAQLMNSSTFNVSSLTVSTILPQIAGRTITIPTTVQASTLLASTMGIGVATPSYTLDVNGTGRSVSSFYITGQNNSTIFLSLGPAPSATNQDYTSQIQSCNNHANNFGSELSFWTHGTATGNVTRAMTITSAQRVGINTSTPRSILDIMQPSGTGVLSIQNNSVSGNVSIDFYTHLSSYVGSIGYGNTGSSSGSVFQDNMFIYHNAKNCVFLGSGATERMRVTSAGLVGIGTSTPSYTLDVAGNTQIRKGGAFASNSYGTTDTLVLNSSSNVYGRSLASLLFTTATGGAPLARIIGFDAESNVGAGYLGDLIFQTGWNAYLYETMRLKGNSAGGFVGIGTSSPTYQLTLTGDIGLDNTKRIFAKNASGGYEEFLTPRWSDNFSYFTYGSAGLIMRNSSGTETLRMTNDRVVTVNNYLKYPGSIVGTAVASEGSFTWSANTSTNKNAISYTPKQSGTVTLILTGASQPYVSGGSEYEGLTTHIMQGATSLTYNTFQYYNTTAIYYRNSTSPMANGFSVSTTITGTTSFGLRFTFAGDDAAGCIRSVLYLHELAN